MLGLVVKIYIRATSTSSEGPTAQHRLQLRVNDRSPESRILSLLSLNIVNILLVFSTDIQTFRISMISVTTIVELSLLLLSTLSQKNSLLTVTMTAKQLW